MRSESFGKSPKGIRTSGLIVLTSKFGGVQRPSLISKVSTWLAPAARLIKMQDSAVARGWTFSLAQTLNGRTNGSRKKPETPTSPIRKNCLRVSRGKCALVSDVGDKLRAVEEAPEQIFRALDMIIL